MQLHTLSARNMFYFFEASLQVFPTSSTTKRFQSELTEHALEAPRGDAVQKQTPLASLERLCEANSLDMVVQKHLVL